MRTHTGSKTARGKSPNVEVKVRSQHHSDFHRFVCAMLAVALLASSTPAAPRVLADAASEWKAGAVIWWQTSSLVASLSDLIAAQNTPRSKPQERQRDRDARVRQVKVYPGDVTVHLYERVAFSAAAFDANDQPVGGVTFSWSAVDEGRGGHAASISPRGEFEAAAPGTYKVTADASGRKEHVRVTVLDAERRRGRDRPSRVYNVSSRDRADAPADSSGTERRERRRKRARSAARVIKSSLAVSPAGEPAAPAFVPDCGDDYGWNRCNYMWGDDPGNRRGDAPGAPVDNGSGNGNFQIATPILSLPGRGLDLTLGLVYNSRVWTKNETKINYDLDQDWPAAGWSLGFGKVVGLGLDKGAMIIDADGTRHGFTGQINAYSWGSVSTLHTNDGTFIDYTTYANAAGTITYALVKYPNGTVAEYNVQGGGAVYPVTITDVNGNFITITYVGNAGPRIETVKDTLGRFTYFRYDANNLLTAVEGPGFNGTTRPLVRLHYKELPTLSTSFVGLTSMVRDYTPWALDAIYYPSTSTGYWFGDTDSYSSYGMIQKVVEQRAMGLSASSVNEQGSVTQGTMSRLQVYGFQLTNLTDAPTFTSLTESHDGMDTSPAVTSFLAFENSSPRTVTVTLPDGTQSVQYSYNHPGAYDDGLVYRDETKDASGNVLRSSDVVWEQGDYNSPRPVSTALTDEQHRTGVEFSYGASHNQVTESRTYDYGYTYQSGTNVLLRKTVTQYHTGAGYASNHVFSLPTVVETYDGATRVTRTEYQYDGATAPATPNGGASLTNVDDVVAQHTNVHNPFAPEYLVEDCYMWDNDHINCLEWNQHWTSDYNPATDYRGNLTQVTSYSNPSSEPATGAVTETWHYDILGNAVAASTSCCELTRFEYTSATQYAYPSSSTRGASNPSSPLHVTTGSVYDFGTGMMLSETDADGRVTQTTYEALTLRPHDVTSPTGARTLYDYDDAQMKVTETTSLSGGAVAAKGVAYLNGLGLVRREEALGAPEAATWSGSVLDVVETKYDQFGRVWQHTRPYRNGSETAQWTTNSYDSLGRLWQIEAPDHSLTTAYFNDLDTAHPRPSAASSAPGETMLTVDAWGKERWARTDSRGRLVEVVEPDPNGSGSVASGGLVTTYSYNALDNLTGVTQGAQQRLFTYDGLGRLVRQKLAETDAVFNNEGLYVGVGGPGAVWSELFAYDAKSNVVSRTDARNVKVSFAYNDDPLNRLQSVSYTVQTGSIQAADKVEYGYDTSGDLSRVLTITTKDPSNGQTRTTEAFRYDSQGRGDQKTLTLASRPGFSLVTNFSYDSLDRMTDVIYPAQSPSPTRKTVHHDYDLASRLSSLTVGGAAYASQIEYNASGQTKTIKVGTAGANQVTESYDYDPVTGLLAGQRLYRGTDPNQNKLLHLSYDYLRPQTSQGRTGKLTKVFDNLNPEKGRTFTYDALGRLKHVGGGDPALASIWTQDYTYDRYGNRKTVTASGNTASMKAPADPSTKTPDVELAANVLPKVPEFMRERGAGSTTDAPAAPLLSGASANRLAAPLAPGAPTNLTVTTSSATQLALSWSAPSGGADHYEVERGQSLSGSYAFVGTAAGNASTFSDTTVSSGAAYLYRVRAVDLGGNRSAPSNLALGAAFTFTDNPVVAQVTTIKAQHLNELRQAVNAVRAVAGLTAATWTDPTLTPQVTSVRAVHVQELRDRLNEALTALQISTSPFTDPVLATGASGTKVKKAHVDELRQRATRGQSAATGGSSSPVPRDGFASLSYNDATNRINSSGWEYDAAGNQTRVQLAANVWQRYEYDAANRLVYVKSDAGAVLASYTYCYSKRRLMAQEGSARTYYTWVGDSVISEHVEADGTPSAASPQWTKNYIYFNARLLAVQQPVLGGERVEYHHPDRLGTRLVSNNADATYFEQTTLPFGVSLEAESTGATNRRFTSYDRSAATGLSYAVNRSYDSQQGRFTQVDPIGMGASSLDDPQSLNMYAYCGNDPVNRTDPDGLFWGKFFKWLGRALKWIAIAVMVAVAIISVVGLVAGAAALHTFLTTTLLGQILGFIASLPALIGAKIAGIGKAIAGVFSFAEGAGITAKTAWVIGNSVIVGGAIGAGAISNLQNEEQRRVSQRNKHWRDRRHWPRGPRMPKPPAPTARMPNGEPIRPNPLPETRPEVRTPEQFPVPKVDKANPTLPENASRMMRFRYGLSRIIAGLGSFVKHSTLFVTIDPAAMAEEACTQDPTSSLCRDLKKYIPEEKYCKIFPCA